MTQFANNIKTVFLLGLMMGLILLMGYFIGRGRPEGVLIAFIIGGAGTIGSYFYSDKIAIASMRGVEASQGSHGDLIEMVQRLSENAQLPMPRVYICPQSAPNAFATGRNPKNAAVAVTQGALQLLTYEELEGVMAHELAHVKNRDTLISTVAAVIAGAISMFAYFGMWFGGGGSSRDGHPIAALLMVLLAPFAAMLIQMAISRSREFVADADGAKIAGTPLGLVSALRKLEAYGKQIPMDTPMPTQNHMFIIEPLLSKQSIAKLFSTHPATEDRVRKLMELA